MWLYPVHGGGIFGFSGRVTFGLFGGEPLASQVVVILNVDGHSATLN